MSRPQPGADGAGAIDFDAADAARLVDELVGCADGDLRRLLADVTPTAFARIVKRSSDADMRALMASPVRTPILDRIMVGMVDAFRPDRAGDARAVVHWKVLDRPDGGYDHYEQVIADGICTGSSTPQRQPTVEIRAKPTDFAKVISGLANTTMYVARGKLRISGDLGLARKLDGWFDKPRI